MAAEDTATLAVAEGGAVFGLLATSRILLATTCRGAVAVTTAASASLATGDFIFLGAAGAKDRRDLATVLDAPLCFTGGDPAVSVMVTDPCGGLLWLGKLGVAYVRLT